MARDYRFAQEEPSEDELDREPLPDDEGAEGEDEGDEIALAIRVARLGVKAAQVLLHGLQASQAGDQPEVKRAIAQHRRLQSRIRGLSAKLPAPEHEDEHVEA